MKFHFSFLVFSLLFFVSVSAMQPEQPATTRSDTLLKVGRNTYNTWRKERGKNAANDQAVQHLARTELCCADSFWGGQEAWHEFEQRKDACKRAQKPFLLHCVVGGTNDGIKYLWPYSFATASDFSLYEIDCKDAVDLVSRCDTAVDQVSRMSLENVCKQIGAINQEKPENRVFFLYNFSKVIMAGYPNVLFIKSCLDVLTKFATLSTDQTRKSAVLITEITEPIIDHLSQILEEDENLFLIKALAFSAKKVSYSKKELDNDLRRKIFLKNHKEEGALVKATLAQNS
jgi:hypothetical protein